MRGSAGGKIPAGTAEERNNIMKEKKKCGRKLSAAAVIVLLVTALLMLCSACSEEGSGSFGSAGSASEKDSVSGAEWPDMKPIGSMELLYAEEFSVDYYENGCRLVEIADDGGRFLVVPQGTEVPSGLDGDISVIEGTADHIYLSASAVMDHFCKLGAIDAIKLTSTKQENWYIDEARTAMEDGRIQFAGKYNAPDYELILDSGCRLAIESTMIFHAPEVEEQLEERGIPVLVDRSSYESHPLGRSEWIKLYGVLTGREAEAEAVFQEQADKLKEVTDAVGKSRTDGGAAQEDGSTVAFFYITSSGSVNIRKADDYVSKMIELAGGTYVFENLADDGTATSTETIQMEDFYAAAKDADYLIYNSTVDGELENLDELLAKSSLLENFAAVKSGNVYCTGKNMYQETVETGTMILDIYRMLNGDEDGMRFLYRLKGSV